MNFIRNLMFVGLTVMSAMMITSVASSAATRIDPIAEFDRLVMSAPHVSPVSMLSEKSVWLLTEKRQLSVVVPSYISVASYRPVDVSRLVKARTIATSKNFNLRRSPPAD